jgi:hypothetical protein
VKGREILDLVEKANMLSREPFREVLADLLHCKPDLESLKEYANRSPDRWAQAVAIFSRISGYQDKQVIEHEHNFYVHLREMSDAELKLEVSKRFREMGEIYDAEVLGRFEGRLDDRCLPDSQSGPDEDSEVEV